MVDTIRDKASLLALLPDNTSGQISPQDLRDFLASVHGVHACLTMNPFETIAVTPVQAILKPFVAGFTNSGLTVDATNGKFTILTAGTYRAAFNISCHIDTTVLQPAPDVPTWLTFALCKDQVAIVANGGATHLGFPTASPGSGTANDKRIQCGSFEVLLACAVGDEIEVCHAAVTSVAVEVLGANFTIERVA